MEDGQKMQRSGIEEARDRVLARIRLCKLEIAALRKQYDDLGDKQSAFTEWVSTQELLSSDTLGYFSVLPIELTYAILGCLEYPKIGYYLVNKAFYEYFAHNMTVLQVEQCLTKFLRKTVCWSEFMITHFLSHLVDCSLATCIEIMRGMRSGAIMSYNLDDAVKVKLTYNRGLRLIIDAPYKFIVAKHIKYYQGVYVNYVPDRSMNGGYVESWRIMDGRSKLRLHNKNPRSVDNSILCVRHKIIRKLKKKIGELRGPSRNYTSWKDYKVDGITREMFYYSPDM